MAEDVHHILFSDLLINVDFSSGLSFLGGASDTL